MYVFHMVYGTHGVRCFKGPLSLRTEVLLRSSDLSNQIFPAAEGLPVAGGIRNWEGPDHQRSTCSIHVLLKTGLTKKGGEIFG